jgi:hypothetical protein
VVTDPWCVCSMLGLGLLLAALDHALVKILLSVRGFGRAGARLACCWHRVRSSSCGEGAGA